MEGSESESEERDVGGGGGVWVCARGGGEEEKHQFPITDSGCRMSLSLSQCLITVSLCRITQTVASPATRLCLSSDDVGPQRVSVRARVRARVCVREEVRARVRETFRQRERG